MIKDSISELIEQKSLKDYFQGVLEDLVGDCKSLDQVKYNVSRAIKDQRVPKIGIVSEKLRGRKRDRSNLSIGSIGSNKSFTSITSDKKSSNLKKVK